MKGRFLVFILTGFVMISMLSSCATAKKWSNPKNWIPQKEQAAETAVLSATPDDDDKLDELIRDHIDSQDSKPSNQLIKKVPYFYKEYVEYPDGPAGYKKVLHKTDSRTRPMTAEITMKKIRYATQPRKNKDDAKTDSQYIKTTGRETLICELRNSRWTQVSSVFVVARQQQAGNIASPSKGEEESADAPRKKQGWLKKSWNWMTFWKK